MPLPSLDDIKPFTESYKREKSLLQYLSYTHAAKKTFFDEIEKDAKKATHTNDWLSIANRLGHYGNESQAQIWTKDVSACFEKCHAARSKIIAVLTADPHCPHYFTYLNTISIRLTEYNKESNQETKDKLLLELANFGHAESIQLAKPLLEKFYISADSPVYQPDYYKQVAPKTGATIAIIAPSNSPNTQPVPHLEEPMGNLSLLTLSRSARKRANKRQKALEKQRQKSQAYSSLFTPAKPEVKPTPANPTVPTTASSPACTQ